MDPKPMTAVSPYSPFLLNPMMFVDRKGDTNEYFDIKTGKKLGIDTDVKNENIRIINEKEYNSIVENNLTKARPASQTTEQLIASSQLIQIDPNSGNYVDSKVDKSNISDAALTTIINYYYVKLGYKLNDLRDQTISVSNNRGYVGVTSYDPLFPDKIQLDISKRHFGNIMINKYDLMSILVHERGGHGSDIIPILKITHNRAIDERRATEVQVRHWTWKKTSVELKRHMANTYGGFLSGEDQAKYFHKYLK